MKKIPINFMFDFNKYTYSITKQRKEKTNDNRNK